MNLAEKNCKPCEGGVSPLTEEAKKHLLDVPGWKLNENTIVRDYKFNDFIDAASWLERIKFLAEAQGHHPNIHWSYNKITLELTTHAIGGLSENDFIFAAKVNQL